MFTVYLIKVFGCFGAERKNVTQNDPQATPSTYFLIRNWITLILELFVPSLHGKLAWTWFTKSVSLVAHLSGCSIMF